MQFYSWNSGEDCYRFIDPTALIPASDWSKWFLNSEDVVKTQTAFDRGPSSVDRCQVSIRSHYPERASVLDFKEADAPQFGYSDVVFCLFLVTNIKSYHLSVASRNT